MLLATVMPKKVQKKVLTKTDLVELVEGSQRGERAAFEGLVTRYQKEAYAYAFQMLSSVEDADDVVQEGFLLVYRSVHSLRDSRKFRSWLYQILTNLCYNAIRRRQRNRTAPFEEEQGQEGTLRNVPKSRQPSASMEYADLKAALDDGIERLPPQQKGALVLRTMQGLPYSEIAEILSCNEKTVRAHLFLAREKLKTHIEGLIGEA